jgi:hypothetical protein
MGLTITEFYVGERLREKLSDKYQKVSKEPESERHQIIEFKNPSVLLRINYRQW